MSDANDVSHMKEELDKDKRDVADLWNEALRKYKGIVGVDLKPNPELSSVDAMVQFGTEQMNNFHKFRHDKKKVDKLRGLLKDNLGFIETGAQQLISAATPAFPPAAAIGIAFTYMLSACRQVSADYDVVTVFFEDMNSFLQRITILESRLPKYPAYRNCLMDVFTSLLEMCGYATKYIELGRFRKWIMNMVGGEDSELAGARKKMDTSLSRLQAATEYAILGNTEELQRMNHDLRKNQEMQTQRMEEQTHMLEAVLERQDGVRTDLMNIHKLLVVFNEHRQEGTAKQGGSKPTGRNKPPTSNRVRSIFQETMDPAHEYLEIKDTFIPDTCKWLFEEPAWAEWVAKPGEKDSSRILVISGPPGVGKSHMAVAAHDELVKIAEQDTSNNTCVAHFYFRESTTGLDEFCNAVNWATVQIAEQNALLCEKLNVEMSRDDIEYDTYEWKDIWNKFVKPLFCGPATSANLYLLFDGLDEIADDQESQSALKFLKIVKETSNLNVKVLCTVRSDFLTRMAGLDVGTIAVTNERQQADMKALIWNHLNNDSGLRKLKRYIKQRISSKLEETADCMLYAEHMLRLFDSIGREPVILRKLASSMPENLEKLYDTILEDLQRRTPADKQPALKFLLCWVAFSHRRLTLAECLSLMDFIPDNSLNLEEELQGQQLVRILKIADAEERDLDEDETSDQNKLDTQAQNNPDAAYDDHDLPLKFQERSMRGYFRNASPDEKGLRTPARVAHGQMFTMCSKILCGELVVHRDSIRKYAAENWMWHFSSWITFVKSCQPGEDENETVAHLEALGSIMTNSGDCAKTVETLGVDYDDMLGEMDQEDVLADIALGATMTTNIGEKFNEATLTWAKGVVAESGSAFMGLARAHTVNWFRSDDLKSAIHSYNAVRSAISLTSLSDLVESDEDEHDDDDGDDGDNDDDGDDNDDEEEDDDDDKEEEEDDDDESDEGEVGPRRREEEIVALANAFEDIEKDANAHWVIGRTLINSEHFHAARLQLEIALSKASDPVRRFHILTALADTHLGAWHYQSAQSSIDECLTYREVSPEVLRKALVTRGKIQVALDNFEGAMSSYDEARNADPTELMPGNLLHEEFEVYDKKEAHAELIELVGRWKPLERLAWMTWDYGKYCDQDYHEVFRRAAGKTGRQDFMVKTYEEIIALLDNVDSAPPIMHEFALAQWRVCDDVEAAKAVLDKVLDSSSLGYPYRFTEEDPAYTLVKVVILMTNIIYEQFRCSADHDTKMQLLVEAKGLTQRNLAHSVLSQRSELTPHFLALARMVRKMGPVHQFQETLQTAFNGCYDALTDEVGWNDSMNLACLARAISVLDGMEREAQILLSAQFYELSGDEEDEEEEEGEGDKDVNNDKATDDDDDDDDDNGSAGVEDGGASADEDQDEDEDGDLADVDYFCDGECKPNQRWKNWKDGPMYMCLYCDDCCLCEACYQKRQGYTSGNKSTVGSTYCGPNHRYVRGPVEGWKGIKNGILKIDGEDPIKFVDWLRDLKETKWKAAWERFWVAEY